MTKNAGIAIGFGFVAFMAATILVWETLTDDSEIDLNVTISNLTFPLGTYSIMADTLQTALGDPTALIHFPDMNQVTATFNQLQTADDLKALINAYGVRDRDLFGVSFLTLWEGNLMQTLIACLSDSELQPIRAKFAQFNLPF